MSSDYEYFLNAGPDMPIRKAPFDDFIREVTRLRKRLPEASRGDDSVLAQKISAFFLIDDTWRETLLALRRHHDVAGDYVRTFAQLDEMFEQDASTQRLLHNVGVS